VTPAPGPTRSCGLALLAGDIRPFTCDPGWTKDGRVTASPGGTDTESDVAGVADPALGRFELGHVHRTKERPI
jgi:hypothetical protein